MSDMNFIRSLVDAPERKKGSESSYMDARREWNERYGSYIKQAHQWRLAALGAIAVGIIAVSGLIYVSSQQKVVPFVVELDGDSKVVRVARADQLVTPNANQIVASLAEWVTGARTVYGDLRAQSKLMDVTYARTLPGSPALKMLGEYHEANNPYQRASSEAVDVAINAVLPSGGDTWRVEWTETTKQASGQTLGIHSWSGLFTVVFVAPEGEAQIIKNPLGIYVKEFSWARKI